MFNQPCTIYAKASQWGIRCACVYAHTQVWTDNIKPAPTITLWFPYNILKYNVNKVLTLKCSYQVVISFKNFVIIFYGKNLSLHGNDTLRQWDLLYVARTPVGMLAPIKATSDEHIRRNTASSFSQRSQVIKMKDRHHPSKQQRNQRCRNFHAL